MSKRSSIASIVALIAIATSALLVSLAGEHSVHAAGIRRGRDELDAESGYYGDVSDYEEDIAQLGQDWPQQLPHKLQRLSMGDVRENEDALGYDNDYAAADLDHVQDRRHHLIPPMSPMSSSLSYAKEENWDENDPVFPTLSPMSSSLSFIERHASGYASDDSSYSGDGRIPHGNELFSRGNSPHARDGIVPHVRDVPHGRGIPHARDVPQTHARTAAPAHRDYNSVRANQPFSRETSPLTLADLPVDILAHHLDPDSKLRLMQTASHFRNTVHHAHPEFNADDSVRLALERHCGTALAKQIQQQTYGHGDDVTKTIWINPHNSRLFVDGQGGPGMCARALREHCERRTLSPKQALRMLYSAPTDEFLKHMLTAVDTFSACEVRLTLFRTWTSADRTRPSVVDNHFATALSAAIASSRALFDLQLSGLGDPLIMAALARGLSRNRSLRHLLLMNSAVDARGIGMIGEALAANAQLPLEKLKISGQAIDDRRAAAALVEGIRVQRNLRRLDLSGSYLDDESMHALADALVGHTALAELELSRGERSCYGITPLLRRIARNDLPSLSELKLRGAIQDGQACAPALAAMLERSTSLDFIDLAETGLADAGVEMMVHALERKLDHARDAMYRGERDRDAPKLLRTVLVGGMGVSEGIMTRLRNVLAQNAQLVSGRDGEEMEVLA